MGVTSFFSNFLNPVNFCCSVVRRRTSHVNPYQGSVNLGGSRTASRGWTAVRAPPPRSFCWLQRPSLSLRQRKQKVCLIHFSDSPAMQTVICRAVSSFLGGLCKMLFGGPYFVKLRCGESKPLKMIWGRCINLVDFKRGNRLDLLKKLNSQIKINHLKLTQAL